MERGNPVRDHPEASGRQGGRALAEKIWDLNARFPKPYLLLLNAPHMRRETLEDLSLALTFWGTGQQATPRVLLTGGTLLTRAPVLPLYSLPTRAIQKTRELIGRLNETPEANFCLPCQPGQASLVLLPIHYLGVILRTYSDTIIRTRSPDTPQARRVLDRCIAALVKREDLLTGRAPGQRSTAPPEAIANCQAAARLLRQFAALGASVLARLRRCQNPRCPDPYFLQKPGPRARRCSKECTSLARTPQPKRRRS